MHAAHARLDAYAHNPYPLDPKRETPLTAAAPTARRSRWRRSTARLARRAQLPERAHLADRVRLPEQSARPAARRLARAAGALHRRRRVCRVPHAAGRPADPLPLPRRAEPRALPERPRDARRQVEAGVCGVRAPARADRAQRNAPSLWGQLRAPAAGSTARIERRVGGTLAHGRDRPAPAAGGSSAGPGRCRAARRCACTPASLVGATLASTDRLARRSGRARAARRRASSHAPDRRVALELEAALVARRACRRRARCRRASSRRRPATRGRRGAAPSRRARGSRRRRARRAVGELLGAGPSTRARSARRRSPARGRTARRTSTAAPARARTRSAGTNRVPSPKYQRIAPDSPSERPSSSTSVGTRSAGLRPPSSSGRFERSTTSTVRRSYAMPRCASSSRTL